MTHNSHNRYPDLLTLQVISGQPSELAIALGTTRLGSRTHYIDLGLTGFQLQFQPARSVFTNPTLTPIAGSIDIIQPELEAPPGTYLFWVNTSSLEGKVSLQLPEQVTDPETPLALKGILSPVDVRIIQSEGWWHHDIHPNQATVLERFAVTQLFEQRSSLAISTVQFAPASQRDAQLSTELTTELEAFTETSVAKLQAQCDRILRAGTQFEDLVAASQLNLKSSFAGGNFLGAELKGIDWSNANLQRANCRGADLTDVDLSEADLSYSRLNGADLSGALLSGANLRHANLHRASLALTNLSGVDLRDANLQEANLSQASLQQANVQGTQFGDNPGLLPSLQADLIARGAIFSHR
jgi:uncharacterized protein YjbI with pentapeptide repeats